MTSSMLSASYNKLNNNNQKYIVYFLSISLILGYIIKDEMYPLIFFIIFSGLIYYLKKNKLIALLSSIIVTNLLIVLNIFNYN